MAEEKKKIDDLEKKKTGTKKSTTKKTTTSAAKKKTTTRKTSSIEKKDTDKISKKAEDKVSEEETKNLEENSFVGDFEEANISYCANCGKKLINGDKCSCANEASSSVDSLGNIDTDKIIKKGKGIFDIILSVYKKPFSTCKEETLRKDSTTGLAILAIIALSMGFLIAGLTYAAFHINVNNEFMQNATSYYNIPYFKIFIVWSFVAFIMGLLPILITHIFSLVFSNSKFSLKQSLNLYASSMSVVILVNIAAGIFMFAGLFVKFFLLVSLLSYMLGFINYLIVYKDIVVFDKEKSSYIILAIILLWILGAVIVADLFASGADGLNAYNTMFSTLNN